MKVIVAERLEYIHCSYKVWAFFGVYETLELAKKAVKRYQDNVKKEKLDDYLEETYKFTETTLNKQYF